MGFVEWGAVSVRGSRFITVLLVLLVLFPAAVFAAEGKLRVEGIRYGVTGNGIRIVFDLSQKTEFRAFVLDQPYRIVLDLPPAEWNTFKSRLVTNDIIKSYRSGERNDGLTRVIFDMKKSAVIDKVFTVPKDGTNKDRLVIDLKPVSADIFNSKKNEVSGKRDLKANEVTKKSEGNTKKTASGGDAASEVLQAAVALTTPVLPVRKPAKKYTIVIDAGHGGEDPGAVENGVKEKMITLAVAQELKRQLEESGRYKVVLTRDRDVYVKLHERVDISRHVGGDLFISIHADKIDRRGIRGASIYTLSETASDAETARLAEEENNSGFVAGVDLSQETQDVADILLDLAMREKMNESNMFARVLKQMFLKKSVRLLPNSHRSAGFAVLKAPDVPSVLIEIGFVSNPEEAKLLSSGRFQQNISAALLDGVDAYFRKIQSLQKR